MANFMSGLQGAMKMNFRRLYDSWSNHDSLSSVYQDWLFISSFFPTRTKSKRDSTRFVLFSPLLVLVFSRPENLIVSPSWRSTTTSVKYRLVFVCSKNAHVMVVWSRPHHVIHVTLEDRIAQIESPDRL